MPRPKTALLVIDIQPEWYSGSHVAKLFPDLGQNVASLLRTCRASGVEVVHIRAHYNDSNKIGLPGGDWGSWLKNFRQLNPEKASIVDGTTVVEPFAKEEGNERLFMKPTWCV